MKKIQKNLINQNESQQKNFLNEITIMAQLNNPNVVRLKQVIQSSKHYYIIMEYCKDGDLEKHLEKNPETSEEEAMEIL